jgi:RNA 3'-terminal phosphate cyclase (ATP)
MTKIFSSQTINGAMGEGGGQVLRTSLALSVCTGQPFRIANIRARRKNSGLQHQHLAAVRAARDISDAQVEGDEIGSNTLSFVPGAVKPGNYHFAIGTAGSTTLLLQAILYPLLLAEAESNLVLSGGTHNIHAPPYDFLAQTFLPVLNRMGPKVTTSIDRYGFYPRGNGQVTIHITPAPRLKGINLLQRGKILTQQAKALITGIPEHVAQRELRQVEKKLGWGNDCLHNCQLPSEYGPGNALLLKIQSEHITEVFTGFAQRGVKAEAVANSAIKMVQAYLAADVPVGEYLADQLLLPLALAGTGEFTTFALSEHTLTNIDVIQMFIPLPISQNQIGPNKWVIRVG